MKFWEWHFFTFSAFFEGKTCLCVFFVHYWSIWQFCFLQNILILFYLLPFIHSIQCFHHVVEINIINDSFYTAHLLWIWTYFLLFFASANQFIFIHWNWNINCCNDSFLIASILNFWMLGNIIWGLLKLLTLHENIFFN